MQERGNANAQAWNSAIQSAVGEGWQRLGLRQLSGMLVLVYIRSDLLVRMFCTCNQTLRPKAASLPKFRVFWEGTVCARLHAVFYA